jgi:hypothetical protein
MAEQVRVGDPPLGPGLLEPAAKILTHVHRRQRRPASTGQPIRQLLSRLDLRPQQRHDLHRQHRKPLPPHHRCLPGEAFPFPTLGPSPPRVLPQPQRVVPIHPQRFDQTDHRVVGRQIPTATHLGHLAPREPDLPPHPFLTNPRRRPRPFHLHREQPLLRRKHRPPRRHPPTIPPFHTLPLAPNRCPTRVPASVLPLTGPPVLPSR